MGLVATNNAQLLKEFHQAQQVSAKAHTSSEIAESFTTKRPRCGRQEAPSPATFNCNKSRHNILGR
jgi:hypothetical protein